MASPIPVTCSWCDRPVEPDDGWRLYEASGERSASFCRLEHIVPWALQGPYWEPGRVDEPPGTDPDDPACSQCGTPVDPERHLLLVRHRAAHRIPDDFCSVEHAAAWAKAGGRWAQ